MGDDVNYERLLVALKGAVVDHGLEGGSVAITILIKNLVLDLAGVFIDPEIIFFVRFDH